MNELDGRVALVTGGSIGLGRGAVAGLVRSGARVVSVDRQPPKWDSIIVPKGVPAPRHVDGDICEPDIRASLMELLAQELGGLDIAVNNAAVLQRFAPVVETDDAEVQRVFEVNVFATYAWCRDEARLMKTRGSGVILNVASQAGKLPWPGFAVYGMSKAAVIALSQAMARELGPDGVRVNAICPGVMDTDQTTGGYLQLEAATGVPADALRATKASEIPLGRFGTEDDMAGMVAWLASDASGFTTGSALNLTGGEQVFF